jgi:hypothetical protein
MDSANSLDATKANSAKEVKSEETMEEEKAKDSEVSATNEGVKILQEVFSP